MSVWIVAAASSAVSPAAQRPRARLLLAGGEERDQIERLEQPAGDLARAPAARRPERRRLLRPAAPRARPRASRSMPAGPLRDRDAAAWSSAARAPAAARPATPRSGRPASRCASSGLELLDLRRAAVGSPDFACLRDPLEPPLDVVAVGDEQLELQRLEVVAPDRACRTSRRGRRAARPPDAGCRAAAAPVPGTSTTRTAAGVTFFAVTTAASALEALVGNRRHADVRPCR